MARQLALQLAISAGFIAVLVWRVDMRETVRVLRSADWRWVALAIVLAAVTKAVHGVRWWLLVRRAGRVPLVGTVLVLLAASGVSVVLPLRAGAALQLQVLHRRYGVDRAAVAGTLILEGLLDAAALLLLALLAVPLVGLRRGVLLAAIGGAGAAAAVTAVLFYLGRRDARALLPLIPQRLRRPVAGLLTGLARGLATAGSPRALVLVLLVTLTDWLLAATASYLVGQAFGLGAPPYAYMAIEVAGNLASAVPLTQSSIGTYELAVRETLGFFGADGSRAGAYAIANHATIIIAIALTGLAGAWALRLRGGDLFYVRVVERAERPTAAATPADTA